MRGVLLGRTLRMLKALSASPRAAALGKDWMVAAWMLVMAIGLLSLALPPKLDWILYVPLGSSGVPALLMVLALSAGLVARREFWRR